MSKKRIRDAAKELERALKKHAEIVTDSAVSMKKAQRAAARLASAAEVYAEAVTAKTGLDNPFLGGGQLDAGSKESLLAERDEIAKDVTGAIPVIPGSGLEEGPEETEDAEDLDDAPWFSASPAAAPEPVADGVPGPVADAPPTDADEPAVAPSEDPAPALPESEPATEEQKPYAEDE